MHVSLCSSTSVSAPSPTENQYTPEQLEDMWDEVSGELSALFQGRGELPTDVSPFDAASEVDVDQQRYLCRMLKDSNDADLKYMCIIRFKVKYFYAPALINRGHIVFIRPTCRDILWYGADLSGRIIV